MIIGSSGSSFVLMGSDDISKKEEEHGLWESVCEGIPLESLKTLFRLLDLLGSLRFDGGDKILNCSVAPC